MHVQVADVGFLGVGLQTLSDPGGLGAPQEGVGDEDESYTTHDGTVLSHRTRMSLITLNTSSHMWSHWSCGGNKHTDAQEHNTYIKGKHAWSSKVQVPTHSVKGLADDYENDANQLISTQLNAYGRSFNDVWKQILVDPGGTASLKPVLLSFDIHMCITPWRFSLQVNTELSLNLRVCPALGIWALVEELSVFTVFTVLCLPG